MGRTLTIATLTLLLSTSGFAQQGGFGGAGQAGFGGGQGGFGGGGMQGGGMNQRIQRTTDNIQSQIATYLDGDEVRNILTPGEYSEWPLKLKQGQVVIAEARSDAFDPALEVVDEKNKVLASNDDRFPGDQRPLLLWRCEKAGSYAIHARCFHDKSGGQVFLRLKIYDSIDAGAKSEAPQVVEHPSKYLVRVPMKAGQIETVSLRSSESEQGFPGYSNVTISPTGLPDAGLAQPLAAVAPGVVMAPVDGDYYEVVNGPSSGPIKVRTVTTEIKPQEMSLTSGTASAQAPANTPMLEIVHVKAGDFLEATGSNMPAYNPLVVAEAPDISKYDLKNPDMNPFYPEVQDAQQDKGAALVTLPARARDSRTSVFVAKRDANVWLAMNPVNVAGNEYVLSLHPAPKAFAEDQSLGNKLSVGKTDYWAFDAKVGDVLTFDSKASTFAEEASLIDPELQYVHQSSMQPDQTSAKWQFICQKAGRYSVAISSTGGGGGGDYELERKVLHPREFGKRSPASGELANGQVVVWRFTARPEEPVMVHWKSSLWNYNISVRTDSGADANLPLTPVSGTDQYGILKVDKPTTFLIVLSPNGSNAKYSIELTPLPKS